MTDRKPIFFSRPKDKSLEAFKAWINEFTQKMGAKESNISEEEWIEDWKKFWGVKDEQGDEP